MKKNIVLTSLILSCLLLLSAIIGHIPQIIKIDNSKVRNFLVEDVSTLSYEDLAQRELQKFEEFELYEDEKNEDILIFTGTRKFSTAELSELDYVASSDSNEDVEVNYDLVCDKNTTQLNATITYEQEDIALGSENIHITKIEQDESSDNSILYLEDGSILNTADLFSEDYIDNCLAAEAAIAASFAAVVQTVIYVVVIVCVAVIVYYFLSWLFGWCSKTRITYQYQEKVVPKITTYQTPSITIGDVRYETSVKTKEEVLSLPKIDRKGNTIYYLAFASGISNGEVTDTTLKSDGLFISAPITYTQALAIMTSPTYTTAKQSNGSFSYIPSIYSYYETSIIAIMEVCGYSSDTPRNHPESHNGGLLHYHPSDRYYVSVPVKKGSKKYRPHAFFAEANESYWIQY